MTVDEIVAEIWQLPWYEVFIIAVKDDGIFYLKTWWLWIPLWVVVFASLLWGSRDRRKEKRK